MVIAEGTRLEEIVEADDLIAEGEAIDIQLMVDRPVDEATLDEITVTLERGGIGAEVYQDANVIHVKTRKPVAGGVGIAWLLPLLGVGSILVGLLGWKIMTTKLTDIAKAVIPIALIIGAFAIFYFKVLK